MIGMRILAPLTILLASTNVNGQPYPTPRVAEAALACESVYRPVQMRVSRNGDRFVLSNGDHSVVQVDSAGRVLKRIGRIGNGPGELYRPTDFAFGPDESLWIADRGNNRIVRFNSAGSFVNSFRTMAPLSIGVVGEEVAVVGEYDFELLHIFSTVGTHLRTIGTPIQEADGGNSRQQAYSNRGVVAVDGRELLYVFKGVLKPTIHRYSIGGELLGLLQPDGTGMKDAIARAAAKRVQRVRDGVIGSHSVLHAAAINPMTRSIWVAPAGPALYVYSPRGDKIGEYTLHDPIGRTSVGAFSLAFDGKGTGFVTAGNQCWSFGPVGM